MYVEIIIYAVIGVASGFLAGLLGIGGGIVAVPALFFFMGYFGIEQTHLMHSAIATSLASMIFSALSSMISHQKRKAIQWSVTREMLFGLAIGSFFGAYLAQQLSTKFLLVIFGAFLGAIGIQFFDKHSKHKETKEFKKPGFLGCSLAGISISFVAALLGLGGGLFTVPVLTTFHMRIRHAIATSSAVSFFITVMSSICYFLLGFKADAHHASFGFIYLPAFITISIFALVFAPLGVKVVQRIDTHVIKKVFGSLLLVIGIYMIVRGVF